MALIDTEGRCMRERMGKSTAFTGDKKSGKLVFNDHGLAPQENHNGCWQDSSSHGRKHIGQPSTQNKKAVAAAETGCHIGGKKYIVMEHQLYSDDRKRQQGKIGLKKLQPYVQENERVKCKPGSALRGLTSEQRAARNIQNITHQDPNQLDMSGKELFVYEERVQREQRVKEASAHMQQRQAQQQPLNRNAPSSISAYAKAAPYAVVGGDEVPKGFKKQALRKVDQPPSALLSKPRHQGRSVDPAKFNKVPTPFDTMDPSKPYPEPPRVGERTDPFHGRGKANVHGQGECSMDWDSVVRKRAEARPSRAPAARTDNVIFGNPSPEPHRGVAASPKSNRGVGHSLLEHNGNRGGDAGSARVGQAGVRMNENHYKPTSLW